MKGGASACLSWTSRICKFVTDEDSLPHEEPRRSRPPPPPLSPHRKRSCDRLRRKIKRYRTYLTEYAHSSSSSDQELTPPLHFASSSPYSSSEEQPPHKKLKTEEPPAPAPAPPANNDPSSMGEYFKSKVLFHAGNRQI